ncbi:hypothetical protein SAMN05444920_113259 [Nonomuraea solani]|uniref:Uncharacterized protein n=1 Tax=Nonomuraea solani TaxID=1144553 RepID=A0A1H6EQH8_9ACTN|nr:hypothetical protein [Nonomuraea solani]SEG99663.1 hypothetical protein SAMN05444920_113259 [Nonomuraea solani]
MIGLTGCTASAESGGPTSTPSGSPSPSVTATNTTTTTASPRPSATRQTVLVEVNPDRVTAGETSTVWVMANCPVPGGGPAHTGTATSRAFVNGVALSPVPAASLTPTPTNGSGSPWVRGEARVGGAVRRGTYPVEVKCDGTNHTGKGTLRVVRAESDADDDVPTGVPTRAPRAGGGGTYAQDVSDESSIPLGPAGVVVALALAAGIGFAVKRRNRA